MNQNAQSYATVKAELAQLRADIDDLETKVENDKDSQDVDLDQYLKAIEDTGDEIDQKLEELKQTGGEATEELKKGLKDAWNRLAIAGKAAKARIH